MIWLSGVTGLLFDFLIPHFKLSHYHTRAEFAKYSIQHVKLLIMVSFLSGHHWRSPYADILTDRLSEPRRFIQMVSGPRQVGKTTMALQSAELCAPPNHYATADDPSFRGQSWIEQQWNVGRDLARNDPERGATLILDEIQKVEGWSEVGKRLWDEDTFSGCPLRVVLLGSTPLLAQKGLTESLAGRFEMLRVPHWSFGEMRDAFGWDLESYILFGGYPGTVGLSDDPQRLMDYVRDAIVEPTVSRDILSLTDVRRPALLRRLFELSCVYCANVLSYNKMLGQLQDAGNSTTLAHYLELLADAGMVRGLQKYNRSGRRRASSPKLQPLNTGLVTATVRYNLVSWLQEPSLWGTLVECAVGAHLANWAFSTNQGNIHYWRSRDSEVDFVVSTKEWLLAIEVKSGPTRPRHSRGLQRFRGEHPDAVPLLVGGDGVPLEEFLGSPVDRWVAV